MPVDKEKERLRKAQYNLENKEYINARQRLYRLNNPEKIKEQRKRFRKNHNEQLILQSREYYKQNKDRMNNKNKKYRQEHRKYLQQKKNEWVVNNKLLRAKYSREYQQKHPEATLQRQIKLLIRIGKTHNLDHYETKLALFTWGRAVKKRDNNKCIRCGSTSKLEAHHIKHKKTNPELAFDVSNGITLCDQCHYKEHGKLVGR